MITQSKNRLNGEQITWGLLGFVSRETLESFKLGYS